MIVKDFEGVVDGQGVKFDTEKPRTDLIPPNALLQLGEVFRVGAKKYADNNWMRGMKYSRLIGAMLRHLLAFMGQEDHDPETGLPHIAQVMWGCSILLYFAEHPETYGKFDDRIFQISESIPIAEKEDPTLDFRPLQDFPTEEAKFVQQFVQQWESIMDLARTLRNDETLPSTVRVSLSDKMFRIMKDMIELQFEKEANVQTRPS